MGESSGRLGTPDRQVTTDTEMQAAIDRISFKNTIMDFQWKFRFRPFFDAGTDRSGWLLWVEFTRPDSHTGVLGTGRGREEIVWSGATESSIIKTCWLLVELLVRHELMEGFRVDDKRIFDPHNTIADLQLAQMIGTRKHKP